MPTNYLHDHENTKDIPKGYKKYWDELADPNEAKKYDSTRAEYNIELKEELNQSKM